MAVTAIYPKVSIIIPIRNEEKHIDGCLERLLNQTYPKDRVEIIVVDGMSEDRTRDIVSGYSEILNRESEIGNQTIPVIRLLDNPKGQRASALNIGIREAKGDVIMRIDARTVISFDYIEKCVKTLMETGADNVGGILQPLGKTPIQRAIGLAMSHPFGAANAQFRIGKKSGFVDTVYPGCFRRSIFDRVGLFDEEAPIISEDSDINHRIREAGGKVYLDTNIVVYYQPRESIRDFWKLYFRYGGARAGNLLKHKKLTAWRQLGPPMLLASLLGLAVLSLISNWFLVGLITLCGIYLTLNLIVSGSICLREREPRLFVHLFFAFLCIHFAWPLGFYKRLLERPKPGEYWGY